MGLEALRPVARHLAAILCDFGFSTVMPCRSYDALEQALLSGEAAAAWAPPAVAAEVERAGGVTILRALRMGSGSYRSALICRGERSIDLKRLDGMSGLAPLRAAWVDPQSAAGYLVPRNYLAGRGAELGVAVEEQFFGSYRACFDAVLEGDADLTASYVGRRGSGYIDLCGEGAADLRVLAWTEEIPNDGVVVSPALDASNTMAVTAALTAAFTRSRNADSLALALDADGFESPTGAEYAAVPGLARRPLPEPPQRLARGTGRHKPARVLGDALSLRLLLPTG